MRSFFGELTAEQQKAVLAYRGPENHGDPAFLRKNMRLTASLRRHYGELWGGEPSILFHADEVVVTVGKRSVELTRDAAVAIADGRVPTPD